ncbi:MAG: hypothetical protein ACI4SU_02305 [Anaerovoracaceae bacterium]
MFEYNIHNENSTEIFKETCDRVEIAFPNAKKSRVFVDVDGSTIQTFTQDGKDIDIFDDYDVGAVFIKSEIELNNIF